MNSNAKEYLSPFAADCRKQEIAKDPSTAPSELLALAKRGSIHVRFLVAGNPASPGAALRLLMGDRNGHTARRAERYLMRRRLNHAAK